MILILSNSAREADLLAALCDQRSWPCHACTTISELKKMTVKTVPRAVISRHRLSDGYSDDVFGWLKSPLHSSSARVIVLMQADCTIRQEARQVALGADCVLRDPLRMEVLLEYLDKYRTKTTRTPVRKALTPSSFEIAGVRVFPDEYRLVRAGKSAEVSPQEIGLLRLLFQSAGRVTSYPVLYCDLFNRRFTGDTANCRVLLAKTAASFQSLHQGHTQVRLSLRTDSLCSTKPQARLICS
jgi:DNA-binding response OmpR family regulator